MKDIENIEEWYRNELSNYNVEPDVNGWNSIAENLDANTPLTDQNISDWYKKEVVKLEERPDYTVWEKLSTKLDTASVWDKLAISLDRYELFIWWRNVIIKGSAVLLFLFGSYLTYNNYTNNNNSLAENSIENTSKKTIEKEFSTSGNNKTVVNLSSTTDASSQKKHLLNDVNYLENKIIKSKKNTNTSSHKEIKKAANKSRKKIVSKKSSTNKEQNLYASNQKIDYYNSISIKNLNALKTANKQTIFTTLNRKTIAEQNISQTYSSSEFLVKKNKNKIVFNSKRFSRYSMFGVYAKRIYAGFNIGVKKQEIINKIKKGSLLSQYNQANFLDFGNNFGGTIGFIVSDKFNIEANVNLNSTAGYKRAFNAEGVSYQENLNLNYTTINLLAKKMNTKSTFDNKVYSTNFIGGIYASYLRNAVSDINGVSRNLDEYNSSDFGIILGVEQDRYITKTLVITPGIRYNQGISNITNSDSPFESSRNFSFEFNLGVKYIFLKKGK